MGWPRLGFRKGGKQGRTYPTWQKLVIQANQRPHMCFLHSLKFLFWDSFPLLSQNFRSFLPVQSLLWRYFWGFSFQAFPATFPFCQFPFVWTVCCLVLTRAQSGNLATIFMSTVGQQRLGEISLTSLPAYAACNFPKLDRAHPCLRPGFPVFIQRALN